MHIGHIKHFNEAKENGDILIVSLTKDEFINKGFNRPVFKIDERMLSIAALEIVDFVVESPVSNALKVIQALKPDIYAKGPDYKNLKLDKTKQIKFEKKIVETLKGKIIFTKSSVNSSTKLLFDSDMIFSSEQKKF